MIQKGLSEDNEMYKYYRLFLDIWQPVGWRLVVIQIPADPPEVPPREDGLIPYNKG